MRRPLAGVLAATLAAALLFAVPAAAKPRSGSCAYLPQFNRLQRKLPKMAAVDALRALEAYASSPDNDNPAPCEALRIDALARGIETTFVTLSDGKQALRAQQSYRCSAIREPDQKCEGPVEDLTSLPDAGAALKPYRAADGLAVAINPVAAGYALQSLWIGNPALQQDGTPPVPISGGAIPAPALARGIAVIAIIRAPGTPGYRKFVWYF